MRKTEGFQIQTSSQVKNPEDCCLWYGDDLTKATAKAAVTTPAVQFIHLRGRQRAQVRPVFNGCGSRVITKDLARIGLHVDLLKLGVAVLVGVSLWRCGRRCRSLSWYTFIMNYKYCCRRATAGGIRTMLRNTEGRKTAAQLSRSIDLVCCVPCCCPSAARPAWVKPHAGLSLTDCG